MKPTMVLTTGKWRAHWAIRLISLALTVLAPDSDRLAIAQWASRFADDVVHWERQKAEDRR